jgi:hypothetical protein
MLSTPIASLELQTQWRLPHKDEKTGKMEFFDGFSDWSWWVWDCLELFAAVKELKIVHTWRAGIDGLQHLKHCLEIDMQGLLGYRSTNTNEPARWRVVSQVTGKDKKIKKLFLVGMKERKGREIEIECVAVSKEDMARYCERSYGWNVGQLGKSWLSLPTA